MMVIAIGILGYSQKAMKNTKVNVYAHIRMIQTKTPMEMNCFKRRYWARQKAKSIKAMFSQLKVKSMLANTRTVMREIGF